ncbi:MAG: hypothetical protein H7249_00630 [Chitinophagaceae bacterium]|nr:hypothetical protein [Oligoflexus sp.]
MKAHLLCSVFAFFLTSCAYSVHDVYVSGFEPAMPQTAGKLVTAHSEQLVILGFTGNTHYLDQAYDELQGQCPSGDIVGIVTEYQTALGFLSWHNHIYMKALCTAGVTRKKA